MPAFTVAPAEAGLRLDVVLAARQRLSRAAVQRLIAAGSVTVDGVPQTKHHHVQAGETVEYAAPPVVGSQLAPEALDIEVVYRGRLAPGGEQGCRCGRAPGAGSREGHTGARLARARYRRRRHSPAGDRAPARQGHVGPHGGRPSRRGLSCLDGGHGASRSGPHVRGPAPRRPAAGRRAPSTRPWVVTCATASACRSTPWPRDPR